MTPRRGPGLEDGRRPPFALGLASGLGSVALTTLLIEPLKQSAPVESLGVAYVPAVLLVSSAWGGSLGFATALLSAAAFNWFHLPPTGRLELSDSQDWVALAVLLVVALVVGTLGRHTRAQVEESARRRTEADLAAALARRLLRGAGRLPEALPVVSAELADSLGVPSAGIVLEEVGSDGDVEAFPLREGGRRIGTLVLPVSVPSALRARIAAHVVPSLEAVLAAALERDGLLTEVVETSALRRSDDLKTALLRAVSHDLRTPLTAILAAEEALRSSQLTRDEHGELVDDVGTEARRLSSLVDKLLDLSRLEADGATARPAPCSLPEVIDAAVQQLALPEGTFRTALDADLPEVLADAGQLERVFVNLLENAARFSGDHPVAVRGRHVGDRVLIRIVDRGPGLPGAEERIFEPFFRGGTQPAGARGSGLGLAIVRGFVEANGGRVWAETVPKQGTTFVVEFPAPREAAEPEPAGADPPAAAGAQRP